jgi:hypothetical protein
VLSSLNAGGHLLKPGMPPRLIFIDQIALAGCARTPFSGFVMTGSTLSLASDKFEFYLLFWHWRAIILSMHASCCPNAKAASKQRISARISVRYRCFSDPLRPQLQDFCGSDEIGG